MDQKHSYRLRLLLGIIILGSCVGCDQVTKSAATQLLRNAPPRTYLSNIVRLEYALNPGGFLSLGSTLPDAARKWLFIGFNSCMLLALSVILLLKRDLRLMQ